MKNKASVQAVAVDRLRRISSRLEGGLQIALFAVCPRGCRNGVHRFALDFGRRQPGKIVVLRRSSFTAETRRRCAYGCVLKAVTVVVWSLVTVVVWSLLCWLATASADEQLPDVTQAVNEAVAACAIGPTSALKEPLSSRLEEFLQQSIKAKSAKSA